MHSFTATRAYADRARKVVPGGVSSGLRRALQPHPIAFDIGRDGRLIDIDGNEYVDHVLAWGPMLLGHSHPAVVDAVIEQTRRLQLPGGTHTLEARVGEQVLAVHPWAERILWSNTGTEAIQVAIRLARAKTGRRRLVKFGAAYHGWHDSVLISYRNLGTGHEALPESAGQNPSALDDMIVLPFGDLEATRAVIGEHADEIGAVLVEATLTNSGLIPPPPGFLDGLRELCDRYGIVLILDEVITGFRLALDGAVGYHGVRPDLAVYAKAIANGFSVSAVVGSAELLEQVLTGTAHSGTYNGSPIALAAASATIQALTEAGVHTALARSSTRLGEALAATLLRSGIPGAVRVVPGIVQVLPHGSADGSAEDFVGLPWDVWDRWSARMSARGIHALPAGRLFVSTAHTEDDLERTIHAFETALEEDA